MTQKWTSPLRYSIDYNGPFPKEVRVVEPLAILIMAYLGYMVAEVFHWSGILSLVGENESVDTNPVQTKM